MSRRELGDGERSTARSSRRGPGIRHLCVFRISPGSLVFLWDRWDMWDTGRHLAFQGPSSSSASCTCPYKSVSHLLFGSGTRRVHVGHGTDRIASRRCRGPHRSTRRARLPSSSRLLPGGNSIVSTSPGRRLQPGRLGRWLDQGARRLARTATSAESCSSGRRSPNEGQASRHTGGGLAGPGCGRSASQQLARRAVPASRQ
jgi:hypothetical protein